MLGAVLGWLPGRGRRSSAVAAVVFLVPVRAQRAHHRGSAAGTGAPAAARARRLGRRAIDARAVTRCPFDRCCSSLAAIAEIGGAWLVWQGVREHRGWVWIGAGVIALGVYGFVATLQPDAHFGRILAAYGGVFVAGSLLWGMVADGFRPDRWDIIGALICLVGVAVIMYAPRPS